MYLHHDKEAFEELVTATANEFHIPTNIIEKDYYVTLALRELSSRIEGMVFKGGTSLSKCYQLLDRFSEDLDISYAASEVRMGRAASGSLKGLWSLRWNRLDFQSIIWSRQVWNNFLKNMISFHFRLQHRLLNGLL